LDKIPFRRGFFTQISRFLSDILFFSLMHSKTSLFFPFTSHLSLPCLCVSFVCVFGSSCMPRLRETRLQVQERTAREIRHRTAARLAQLHREAEEERQALEGGTVLFNIVGEDSTEAGLPRQCERCRQFDLFRYWLWCCLLFLFFAYCLYHANKKRASL
jgi:hypothetical protein